MVEERHIRQAAEEILRSLEPHESAAGFRIFLNKSHAASAAALVSMIEEDLLKRNLLSRSKARFVRVDIKAEEEMGIMFITVGIKGCFYFSFHTPFPRNF